MPIVLILTWMWVASCGVSPFSCVDNTQCGVEATCEPSGFCSFPDPSCESGRRYGKHSDQLGDTCVPAPGTGSGTTDEPTSSGMNTTAGALDEGFDDSAKGTIGGSGEMTSGDADSGPSNTTTASEEGGTENSGSSSESAGPTPDDPVVLYTFEEGMGSTVFDRAGHEPPLDLEVLGGTFTWVDDGLQTDGVGIAISSSPTTRLVEAVAASEELTIEAWVTPTTLEVSGPARIVSMSQDSNQRNFTLGQALQSYVIRLRTTATDSNGLPESSVGGLDLQRTHVVYTRDAAGNETFYLDGALASTDVRAGDSSTWTDSYSLMLGNEDGTDRAWPGVFHEVALYDRALEAAEVNEHYLAGP